MKKSISAILALLLCLSIGAPAALAEETGDATPDVGVTDAPVTEETPTPATATPTTEPTAAPTVVPTVEPTAEPTATPEATAPSYIGDQRVTMGADLTDQQRRAVYYDFGIEMGSVPELTVTNKEERKYLEGLVPDRKIGSVALSCCYITTTAPGTGLDIEIHNIDYCTVDMYKNALKTAGISDAHVIVSAPYPVSGTGALTGVYKAYEDITGKSLSSLAKVLGAEELVLTGELSEYIGSTEASEIIGELKTILDRTQGMSDAEVEEQIRQIAKAYNVSLTDQQMQQLLTLCRKLEGLDEAQLQSKLTGLAKTAETANTVSQTVTRVYESVKTFFESVGTFFTNLFSGNWRS